VKKFVCSVLAVIAAGLPLIGANDISGTWEMAMTTPRGEMKMDVVFVQNGETLAVTMSRPARDGAREEIRSEGTIKGDIVEWKEVRRSPFGDEMTMIRKGTLIDADHMKGTMEMTGGPAGGTPPGGAPPEGMGEGRDRPPMPEWTAVRKSK
jgi:hypothetical protein